MVLGGACQRLFPRGLVGHDHQAGRRSDAFRKPERHRDIATLASSVYPFLPGSAYDTSVAQGVGELHAYLTDRAAACPGEVYVLGGGRRGPR